MESYRGCDLASLVAKAGCTTKLNTHSTKDVCLVLVNLLAAEEGVRGSRVQIALLYCLW